MVTKAQQEYINAQAAAQNLDFGDRVRLGLQGASLNTSDEIGAFARSAFGSGTYEDYLADERSELKSARSKPGSLKYEIGGAIVPALAAAPFTGGTSIPLTLVKAAALAGTEGLVAGLGCCSVYWRCIYSVNRWAVGFSQSSGFSWHRGLGRWSRREGRQHSRTLRRQTQKPRCRNCGFSACGVSC